MSSSNLLYVPYRRTQRISLSATLRNIITTDFLQTPVVFETDLTEIDTLRNDIVELEVSIQDLALLKRYYLHLSSLHVKFPSDVEEFPWFGTIGYKFTGPVKLKSLLFERINVLYNIASLYTQLGCREDRNYGEGLKKGCVFFQYAASYFEYIDELIRSEAKNQELRLPLDLQSDVIKALYYISLAQAQEVFWSKAVSDNVKDSLVSRLSLQVASYYDLALQHINRAEGFRTEWIHHVTVKKCHFEAASEYRASLGCMASAKYGEEVARLGKAVTLVRSVPTSLRFVDPVVREEFEGLAGAVEEAYRRAEKDNDLIYLQDVPPISKLSKITPAPAVRSSMDINEIKFPIETLQTVSDYGSLLFKDLLPFTVIQTADSFRDRQEEFINTRVNKPLRSLGLLLSKFLVERQLPGTIDVLDQPEAMPKNIIELSQELKSQGGVNRILQSLDDLRKLNEDGKNFIKDAEKRLELEAKEDSYLRSKQGTDNWTRETSHSAAKPYFERLEALQGYLKHAENGDQVIKESFFEIQNSLSSLELPENELIARIPTAKSSQLQGPLADAVRELKSLLDETKDIEHQRESHIEFLDVKSRQSPILPKIISEYKAIQNSKPGTNLSSDLFESTFVDHMKQFDEELRYVEEEKSKQKELETRISQAHVKFQVQLERSSSSTSSERQCFISNLESSYVKFKELIENITQGLKFYQDFIGNAIKLVQDVEAYVSQRRIQARDLEMELTAKFQSLRTSESNSPPSNNSIPVSNQISSLQVSSDVPERIHSPIPRRALGNTPSIVVKREKPSERSDKSPVRLNTSKSHVWNPASGIKFD